MNKKINFASRYLATLLRHHPEKESIELDKNGYAESLVICKVLNLTQIELEELVETNNKQRFAFNEDKTLIRASQGHSISVDLKLKAIVPPFILYHGTKEEALQSIFKSGLISQNRNHVHLSSEKETAQIVGDRRNGKTIILEIQARYMHNEGFKFYKSANGVWLVNHIPPEYIKF